MTTRTTHPAARALATLGVIAFLLSVAIEHVVDPSLDPANHQISEYVHGPSGWLMTVGFLSWSISLAASAVLTRSLHAGRPIGGALLAGSFGMLLTACFATQTSAGHLPPGVTLSTSGRLHDIGSGITSIALLTAAFLSLRTPVAWLQRSTIGLLALTLPAYVVLLAVGSEVGGWRQRLLILAGCLWQLMFIAATRPQGKDAQLAPGAAG